MHKLLTWFCMEVLSGIFCQTASLLQENAEINYLIFLISYHRWIISRNLTYLVWIQQLNFIPSMAIFSRDTVWWEEAYVHAFTLAFTDLKLDLLWTYCHCCIKPGPKTEGIISLVSNDCPWAGLSDNMLELPSYHRLSCPCPSFPSVFISNPELYQMFHRSLNAS